LQIINKEDVVLEIFSSPVLMVILVITILVIIVALIPIFEFINLKKNKIEAVSSETNFKEPIKSLLVKKNYKSSAILEIEFIFEWLAKLVIFVVACVGLTYIIVMLLGPKYEATSTLFVEVKSNENKTAVSDILVASSKVASNIAEIVKKGEVVDEVIKSSTIKTYTRKQLTSNLRANTIRDTQLIEISVQNTDASEAQRLANIFAYTTIKKYKDLLDEMNGGSYAEVKVIQQAELPTETTFPSVKQAIILSAILGTIIGIGALLIIDLEKKAKSTRSWNN